MRRCVDASMRRGSRSETDPTRASRNASFAFALAPPPPCLSHSLCAASTFAPWRPAVLLSLLTIVWNRARPHRFAVLHCFPVASRLNRCRDSRDFFWPLRFRAPSINNRYQTFTHEYFTSTIEHLQSPPVAQKASGLIEHTSTIATHCSTKESIQLEP